MSGALHLRNRQRTRKVDVRRLRRIVQFFLSNLLHVERFHLGVYLVGTPEITRLNRTFLRQAGATDVISFDYAESGSTNSLCGEVFICIDEAVAQAREFRTTWESELVRYVVHGMLHLCGYDDERPTDRRRMKREEDRMLAQLAGHFDFHSLAGVRTVRKSQA